MDGKAAVKQHLHRRQRPEPGDAAQHPPHRRDRYQTGGMVQQMHRDIGQHDEPGGEPQLAAHIRVLRRPAGPFYLPFSLRAAAIIWRSASMLTAPGTISSPITKPGVP